MKTKQLILCRAKRMISIYLLLRERHVAIPKLAKRYKVNARSIQRDLKLLREAGAKVMLGNFGYYVATRGEV